jgi:hypothetical protein
MDRLRTYGRCFPGSMLFPGFPGSRNPLIIRFSKDFIEKMNVPVTDSDPHVI